MTPRWTITCLLAFALGACDGPSAAGDPDGGTTMPPDEDFVNVFDDACDPARRDQECLEDADDTIRLNRPRALGIVDVAFGDGRMRMRLRADSALRERLAVGKVLVRWRDDQPPLIHRIEELRWADDTAEMRLTRVGLREAFRRGRVRRRFYYDDAVAAAQGSAAPGSDGGIGRAGEALTVGPSDCSGNLIDQSVDGVSLNVDISECSFRFRPYVTLDMEWGFVLPTGIYFDAGGELSASFELTIEAAGEVSYYGGANILSLPHVGVPLFGILTVGVDVAAGYGVTVGAEAYARVGFDYDAEAGVSLQWEKGAPLQGGFYAFDEFTPRGPEVDFEGHVNGSVHLTPTLRVAIIDVLGASVGMKMYAELDLEADVSTIETYGGGFDIEGQACFDLRAGFAPTLGVDVRVLGLDIAEETVELPGLEVPLIENECFDYMAVSTSACTESDECMVDADCSGERTVSPGCTVPICDGACQCDYVEVEGCCMVDADCDDGNSITTDLCDAATHACTHLSACRTDADCDDGDPVTVDTCGRPRPERGDDGCQHTYPPSSEPLGIVCLSDADCEPSGPGLVAECVSYECRERREGDTVECACNDHNPFTEDSCAPVTGECVHTAIPAR